MAIVRLGDLSGETIAVHFGGASGSINAYTFARSLTGLLDTVYEASFVVDPGQAIEIQIVATHEGSYRALLRRIQKGSGGFFSRGIENVFWGIVGAIIYNNLIYSESVKVEVHTQEVVVKKGGETIIVPRIVYEAGKNACASPVVQDGLRRTVLPLIIDRHVTDFGLAKTLTDPHPVVRIPRSEFPSIIFPGPPGDIVPSTRERREIARLVIKKAWLSHSRRKWSFEWNGIPISAPIEDDVFLDRLVRREFLLGVGDALDVEIVFQQTFDASIGVFVNDPGSFVVTSVLGVVASAR